MTHPVFERVPGMPGVNFFQARGVTRTLLLMPSESRLPDEIEPKDALMLSMGAFCFVPHVPEKLENLFHAVTHHVSLHQRHLHLLWVANPYDSDSEDLDFISTSDSLTLDPLTLRFRNAKLAIPAHSRFELNEALDAFVFGGSLQLVPDADPSAAVPVATVEVPFSVSAQGLVRFDVALGGAALDALDVGLRLFWGRAGTGEVASARYPVFSLGAGETLALQASCDPFAQEDRARTYYAFPAATSGQPQGVASCYRTAGGAAVRLVPQLDAHGCEPRLDFVPMPDGGPGNGAPSYLTPSGEFVLAAPAGDGAGRTELLCGLLGTERLAFTPGDDAASATRIRFAWRQDGPGGAAGMRAYVPEFPLPAVSPIGPPVDPDAPLLDATFVTSWACLLAPSAEHPVTYAAQPVGAALFGYDGVVAAGSQTLLGHVRPTTTLSVDDPPLLPLFPYAGVGAGAGDAIQEEVESLERVVIGPTRQQVIAAAHERPFAKHGTETYVATTASGMIAEVACRGAECRYARIVLGRTDGPLAEDFAFTAPTAELQEAFRSSHLLLVVANARSLVDEGGAFANRLDVDGWTLSADVGDSPDYGDYANVLIVKQVVGPLYDPAGPPEQNLITTPRKWTQSGVFSAPTTAGSAGEPDSGQLVALTSWLDGYFSRAAVDEDAASFARFNAIARDPHWTGVLVLRARIAGVPQDLAGIMAGIGDHSRFYAHHVGIEVNPIGFEDEEHGKPVQFRGQSSLFGLVHYVDPEFTDADPPQPVRSPPGRDFDFRILALKVLFENTAVKDFTSTAQITLRRILGAPVRPVSDGTSVDTIVLSGSYQNDHGQPVYDLRSDADWCFRFDGPVISKVEVVGARMNTRDAGAPDRAVVIWFSLAGFVDFNVLVSKRDDVETPIDLFSFGADPGVDQTRKGLAFDGLGLRMTFDGADPAERTFELVSTEMRFDLENSTPRPGSLYRAFALTLEGLVSGTAQSGPREQGYLDVRTDLPLVGVDGAAWHALDLRMDMGSPGALAGDLGLVSRLLLAWTPAARGSDAIPVAVGLALPGTSGTGKLISLQNVLTVSVGSLQLVYDAERHSYVLMLDDIALRLLGLLKIPPAGATDFYLFGDPDGSGEASGLGWYALYKGKGEDDDPGGEG